jgi:hypothetical protein
MAHLLFIQTWQQGGELVEIIYKCPDAPTNRAVSNKYQRASKIFGDHFLIYFNLTLIYYLYILLTARRQWWRWRWRAWAKSWKTRQRDGASDVAERENDAGGRVSREIRESTIIFFFSLSRPANGVNRWPANFSLFPRTKFKNCSRNNQKGKIKWRARFMH